MSSERNDLHVQKCTYRNSNCFGSSHCNWYTEFEKPTEASSGDIPLRRKGTLSDSPQNYRLILDAYQSLQKIRRDQRPLGAFCEINKVLLLKMNITLPLEKKAFLTVLNKRVCLPPTDPRSIRVFENFKRFILRYDPTTRTR